MEPPIRRVLLWRFSSYAIAFRVYADQVARLAGVALTVVPEAQTIDAIVLASAAQRLGEVVYTSDAGDLELLRDRVEAFGGVRVEKA